MIEYKITRQAVDMEWTPVHGAPARELQLHSPTGEDWTLHSFEHSEARVVAVWERQQRPHPMSNVYADPETLGTGAPAPVKTIADIPKP